MIEKLESTFFKTVCYYVIKNNNILCFTDYKNTQKKEFENCMVIVAPNHIPIYIREIRGVK